MSDTTITPEDLKRILDLHARWVRGESGGTRAVLSGAVLRSAALRSAVLSGADLSGAVLRSAVLRSAVLRSAVLRSAVLRSADLSGAVLSGADLSGADLSGADLSGAVLSGAVLSGADLRSAVLRSADLSGAVLRSADLTPIRDDLWAVLCAAPAEVEGLRLALVEGRIDGSSYQGDCACLVGTLANIRHCPYDAIPELKPAAERAAERFFLAIKSGDIPETSEFSRLALEWVETWLANMRTAFSSRSAIPEVPTS